MRKPTADEVILAGEAAVVTAVASFGAVVSYTHIYTLARSHGQSALDARLLPLSVDGLILAASLVLLYEARKGRGQPVRAWFALSLGVAATLAANVLSGLPHGWMNAAISAWSPTAFVVAAELLMFMIHKARPAMAGQPRPGAVPSSVLEAAETWFRATAQMGNPASANRLAEQFSLPRGVATKLHASVLAESNGHSDGEAVGS